jgi:site-specific recombinase XerD
MVVSSRGNLRSGNLKMAELELDKLILQFVLSNKVDGKSLRTIFWYSQILAGFVRFLASISRRPVLAEFNIMVIREFIVHEQDRKLSAYTVKGKVRTFKAFSSWLLREGYTPENLLEHLKLPKVPIVLIEPLSPTEIEQLVKCQNTLTAVGCRNITILIILLDTGERCSELCGSRRSEAHIEEGYFKIMGKGGKERVVPFSALAQKMLWRYVIHFRPKPVTDADDFLFLTLDGKPLTYNAVKLILKRWGKKAGS